MATSNSPEGRMSQGILKPKPNSKWANVLNLEVYLLLGKYSAVHKRTS